jgi:hypothetical protein
MAARGWILIVLAVLWRTSVTGDAEVPKAAARPELPDSHLCAAR